MTSRTADADTRRRARGGFAIAATPRTVGSAAVVAVAIAVWAVAKRPGPKLGGRS